MVEVALNVGTDDTDGVPITDTTTSTFLGSCTVNSGVCYFQISNGHTVQIGPQNSGTDPQQGWDYACYGQTGPICVLTITAPTTAMADF